MLANGLKPITRIELKAKLWKIEECMDAPG
jgi:hypothetical protein